MIVSFLQQLFIAGSVLVELKLGIEEDLPLIAARLLCAVFFPADPSNIGSNRHSINVGLRWRRRLR